MPYIIDNRKYQYTQENNCIGMLVITVTHTEHSCDFLPEQWVSGYMGSGASLQIVHAKSQGLAVDDNM